MPARDALLSRPKKWHKMCIRDRLCAGAGLGQGTPVRRRAGTKARGPGGNGLCPVSYTHLDVYKRQVEGGVTGGADAASSEAASSEAASSEAAASEVASSAAAQ